MMRFEPREEDLNVNIVLRSGIAIVDDEGKSPKTGHGFAKLREVL